MSVSSRSRIYAWSLHNPVLIRGFGVVALPVPAGPLLIPGPRGRSESRQMGQRIFDSLCGVVVIFQLSREVAVVSTHIEMSMTGQIK